DTIAISNPGWDACNMPDSKATLLIKDMEIRGIDRSVIREEKSRIVNDPASHPDRVGTPEDHPTVTSFLGVPLKSLDKTIGMIGLANKESGYDLADQETIEDLSVAFVEALMRKRAEKALQEEEDKYRVLVEESPFGVSLIGKDGDYKYVNPKFVEMFGYALKEIPTGREWFRMAYPDKEYRNQVISAWITAIKETKVGTCRPLIFTVTCKDGSKKEIQFLPVNMKRGGQFLIYEDLTKQRGLEARLNQVQKMEAIGRLAGGVAHDFNNLLTTIIGNVGILLMGFQEEDPQRECLEEIRDAGERAAALTRQLLAFSRKQTLRLVVLNINEVITGIKKMLIRLIGEDVKVGTVLESDLLKVKADRSQMEQLIMNLAVNAKDAMPSGGKITIETKNVYLDESYGREHDVEFKPGPYVMLAVSDTGIGMDDETKSHIFEPFFTTKEKGEGTGLGLSTIYGIVKQTGGYIWVYSEPGQGTTFKIYLPGVEMADEPVQREINSFGRLRGSETVLLVEDDKSLRNMAQKVFKQQGYSVLEAKNGEDALKVAEAHEGPIHLMITDVVMPGMTGRELAERIQSIRPETKVVYMSGYTNNAISHHGVLEPGLNFIEKPFTPENVMRKIREVLDS
ncbi:MAG: response regulator, partial [Proteobacteria bacterium]|nr:response regulator [Pseudomonadota bacterium]